MLILVALFALLAAPALAQEPHLLFHAGFDAGLDADFAAGDGTATVREVVPGQTDRPALPDIERTDGVVGSAIVTEMRYVKYAGGANIKAEAGTVELWVKPLDWTGDDDLFHVFFTTSKEPGWLILYKYLRTEADTGISRSLAFYVQGDPGEERLTRQAVPYTHVSWTPGIWHHLAGVWEKGRAALYVDGAMVAEQRGGAAPRGEFSHIMFGEPWGDPGPRRMALDEARIWDAPLSSDAIRADFAAGLEQIATRAPAEVPRAAVVVKSLGFPAERRIAIYVSAAGLALDPEDMIGRLVIEPVGGGAAVATQALPAFNRAHEVFAWADTTEIPAGEYALNVTVTGPGTEPVTASATHTIPPRPPWWENTLGETDAVLPPYRPIATDGLVVRPWGRDYDFTDTLVLGQVTTHPDPNAQMSPLARGYHESVQMLAGPVAVTGSIGGRRVRVATGQAHVVEAAPDHVTLRMRAAEAGAEFRSEVRLEYDGIARVRLTIAPQQALDLRDLALEIPLDGRHVSLMNFNSVDGSKLTSFAGEAPRGEGVAGEYTWLPLIWLGDEYRGLCWFNDTDRGWLGDTMQKGRIQLVRSDEVATLRLNFCPEARARTEPLELDFCLVATPVRPLPEGWRGLVRDGTINRPEPHERIDSGTEEPVRFRVWWSSGPGMTVHYSYPVAKQPPELLREIWNYAEGVADIQHHYPNSILEGMPMSVAYYGDWSSSSTADLLDRLTLEAPTGGRVDWETNIRDWWLWEINEMMKLGLDGMYVDDPYIYPSYNDRTGGGFVAEDGRVHASYGMLGLREYFRRLRALAQEHSQWPWMDIHMSGQLMLPFYVFFDSFVNGEHLNLRLNDEEPDYLNVLPPAELKAQYLGYQWGVAPFLLPELPAPYRTTIPETRQILAYFLPHDVYFWRGWCNKPEMDRALKVLQHDFRIGEPDNLFLPYWEAGGVIGGQSETLVCSAHLRPGQAMLVIGNWSEAEMAVDLTLNLAALGLDAVANLSATDPVDGRPVALAGNRLTGAIGPRDYLLVWLRGG